MERENPLSLHLFGVKEVDDLDVDGLTGADGGSCVGFV